MRCEVADEPVVVLKSRPLKPGNGVEDMNRDDLIFNDQGARSSKELASNRSRIRGPYVRGCERDETKLITSSHPTRLCELFRLTTRTPFC